MKKVFAVLVCTLLLTGCTFLEKIQEKIQKDAETPPAATEPLETEKPMPRPAEPVIQSETPAQIVTVENFYFEASETGLVLKNNLNKNYEQILSENPILAAEITDGILMYTEATENLEATKSVNLAAFVEFLNQK
ncbi:hypothetical protein HN954_04815 [bacterium]|jgi:hypothetical protein|nr:hypothetical protein [bacterium]MBT6832007.1 hypothetical protein [bacterium]MBT6996717.1 hypothetical protein [bacterium]MBT7772685.1 hypothetical protein [bacterium]